MFIAKALKARGQMLSVESLLPVQVRAQLDRAAGGRDADAFLDAE